MANSVFRSLDKLSSDMILKLSPPKVIVTKTVIVYQGQIPNLALCIYEGSVFIGKTKFIFSEIGNAVILLLDQFNYGLCANELVEVEEGSKISILDKSIVSALEIFETKRIIKS